MELLRGACMDCGYVSVRVKCKCNKCCEVTVLVTTSEFKEICESSVNELLRMSVIMSELLQVESE